MYCISFKTGAVDQNNLEPATISLILDELQDWGSYISGEPEIIHKLRSLEETNSATDIKQETPNQQPHIKRSGPRP